MSSKSAIVSPASNELVQVMRPELHLHFGKEDRLTRINEIGVARANRRAVRFNHRHPVRSDFLLAEVVAPEYPGEVAFGEAP